MVSNHARRRREYGGLKVELHVKTFHLHTRFEVAMVNGTS